MPQALIIPSQTYRLRIKKSIVLFGVFVLLDIIKFFLQSPEKISLQQYNQELSEAEAEYKSGNYISSDEMLQLIRKW